MRYMPRFGYIWLLQLVIPAYYLTDARNGPTAVTGALLLAVFTAVYVVSWRPGLRWKYGCAALELTLAAVLIVMFGPGYVWMLMFPVALLATSVGSRALLVSLAVMSGVSICAVFLWAHLYQAGLQPWWPIVATAGISVLAMSLGASWQAQTMRAKRALEQANVQIERLTKLAERDRISQDLHDIMGHELSMITLKAQLVQRLIDRDPARAKAESRDVEQASRQALTRVREYIADIRQSSLREEWLDAVKLVEAAGMICRIQPAGADALTTFALSDEVQQTLACACAKP